jgi:hypothetical protein
LLKPLVRSLVSTIVTACFAISVASGGQPVECASHAVGGGHQQHAHAPSGKPDQRPAAQACAVHLCCAHLAAAPSPAMAAERLGEAPVAVGLTAATAVPPTRPAHSLPFAHAPPVLS